MSYIDDRFRADADPLDCIAPGNATPPDEDFLAALESDARDSLNAILERVRAGGFPKLWDFHPTLGADLSFCENLDDGVYALANDGSGNYFVLYTSGFVDLWCHDEGGYMEGWDFPSLDSVVECVTLATLAKKRLVAWDDVADRFREMSRICGGWEYFVEDVEEYLGG